MKELKCFAQKIPEGDVFIFFIKRRTSAKLFCESDSNLYVSVTPSLELPAKKPNCLISSGLDLHKHSGGDLTSRFPSQASVVQKS